MRGFRGKGDGFAMERIHLFHGPLAYATGLVERKYTRHGNGVGPFTRGNVILKFNVRYANPTNQQRATFVIRKDLRRVEIKAIVKFNKGTFIDAAIRGLCIHEALVARHKVNELSFEGKVS